MNFFNDVGNAFEDVGYKIVDTSNQAINGLENIITTTTRQAERLAKKTQKQIQNQNIISNINDIALKTTDTVITPKLLTEAQRVARQAHFDEIYNTKIENTLSNVLDVVNVNNIGSTFSDAGNTVVTPDLLPPQIPPVLGPVKAK